MVTKSIDDAEFVQHSLPYKFATIVQDMLQDVAESPELGAGSAARGPSSRLSFSDEQPLLSEGEMARREAEKHLSVDSARGLKIDITSAHAQFGQVRQTRSLFRVSPPNSDLISLVLAESGEKANEPKEGVNPLDDGDTSGSERLSQLVSNVVQRAKDAADAHPELATQAQEWWHAAVHALRPEIDDLVATFDESIFVINRYSRRRGDFKGSQLHLPGLLKAFVTDFRYKKIFSSRTAGGVRRYAVAIVLDISQSMEGHSLDCALASVVMIISALQEIGIDNFSVVVFGETVELVKGPDSTHEWNAPTILSLLSRVRRQMSHCFTRDADALRLTLDLLDSQPSTHTKKVFMLTDGYGSTGLYSFAKQLERAQDGRVDVIGLSVGLEALTGSNVPNAFERWITAKLPQAVASALRCLHEEGGDEDADKDAPMDASEEKERRETDQFLKSLVHQSNGGKTRDEIVREAQDRFKKLTASLNKHRTATLQAGNSSSDLRLDIGVVIDCTGSMRDSLDAIREQFKVMLADPASSLIAKVAEGYQVDLELHFAILGFRDRSDGGQQWVEPKTLSGKNFFEGIQRDPSNQHEWLRNPATQALVPNTALVNEQFNKLIALGGDDWCEDVPAALNRAVSWDDWQSDVRFLLLISDAPCHGAEFNNGQPDDYPGESANSRQQMKQALEKAVEKNITVLHCTLDSRATQKMNAEMVLQAQEAERSQPKGIAVRVRANPRATPQDVDAAVVQAGAKRFTEIKLMGSSSASPLLTNAPHLIFCNDESGSMSVCDMPNGQTRWAGLTQAFNNVWTYLAKSQSSNELCSVMHHDGSSRTIFQNKHFRGAPPNCGPPRYGGNCFRRVAEHVHSMLASQPAEYNPIIVFMSDGGCNDYESCKKKFAELRSQFPNMQVHAVAFSAGADERALQHIADSPAHFHKAISGAELSTTFATIVDSVSDSKVAKHVYEKVAEELASQINHKLMTDCL